MSTSTPDDTDAGDARLEDDLVQEVGQFLGPAPRRDVDAHGLGEVVDAEHHVLHRGVGHDVRGNLQGLGMLDDGLDGDARIHADQGRRQVTDLGRAIGLAGLGQHHHVDVVGQVAQHEQVLVVLLGAEGVDAHRHGQVVPVQTGQFPAQQVARQGLLPAAVLEVEEQRLGVTVAGMLMETLGGRLQVLVQAQGRGVLHRRVVELDAGPVIAQHAAGYSHRGLLFSQSTWKPVMAGFLVDAKASPFHAFAPHKYFKRGY